MAVVPVAPVLDRTDVIGPVGEPDSESAEIEAVGVQALQSRFALTGQESSLSRSYVHDSVGYASANAFRVTLLSSGSPSWYAVLLATAYSDDVVLDAV